MMGGEGQGWELFHCPYLGAGMGSLLHTEPTPGESCPSTTLPLASRLMTPSYLSDSPGPSLPPPHPHACL